MNAVRNLPDWWRARDRREQTMLGVMSAMLAAFVLWYGIVNPLLRAMAAARTHYDDAATDFAAVEADVRTITTLGNKQPMSTLAGEVLARAVLDGALVANVPISRQRVDAQGVLTIGIDAVQATALFGWIESLRREHRIAPQAMTVTKANGNLRVDVSFASARP